MYFCFAGPFIVWNEVNEAALLNRWFDHMREVQTPSVSVHWQPVSVCSLKQLPGIICWHKMSAT